MKRILFVVFVLLPGIRLAAQGCSDAGVCTIHSIKNNTGATEDDNSKNDLVLGFAFGKGERSISYYTPYVEYTRSFSDRTSLTGKISFAHISGKLANTTGFSDLFLSFNHAFDTKNKWQKSFIAGIKIPFDRADIVKKDIHLPMPYQTSLGTTDLVLGLNFILNSFGATIAVQQPLSSVNGNRFLPADYPSNNLAAEYLPTNKFSRKGDMLLRLSYNFPLNKKLSIRPSLLGIYHEANDTYLTANKVRMEIPDSKGLTLNGNVFFDYTFSKWSGIELSLGAPFIIRENRPDGLTRSVVAALEYKFGF
jgi:hypothetical protein